MPYPENLPVELPAQSDEHLAAHASIRTALGSIDQRLNSQETDTTVSPHTHDLPAHDHVLPAHIHPEYTTATVSDTSRVNVKDIAYAGGAKGTAVEVRGTVTGTTLTITSGSIPSAFTGTNVHLAVIEDAGTGGVIPHVTKFTRTSGSVATLQVAAPISKTTAVKVFLGPDDTAAIIAARDAWLASVYATATDSYYFGKSFYFPPGTYICTAPDALMKSTGDFTHTTRGGLIHGALPSAGTRIIFASTQGPTRDRSLGNLMSFRVRAMNFKMSSLSLYSANKNQTIAWMWDTAVNGQAHFTWDSVEVGGMWKSGWVADGDNAANMNSESVWDRCHTRYSASFERALFECGGATETVVSSTQPAITLSATGQTLSIDNAALFPDSSQGYITSGGETRKIWWTGKTTNALTGVTAGGGGVTAKPGDQVVLSADQEDQYLDYTFNMCDFIYARGDTIRARKGGFINVIGGGWIIGVSQDPLSDAGDFFNMPYATHFDDVCHLNVIGTRFEKRTNGTHLLDTHWHKTNAHIEFVGIAVSDNMVKPSRPESRLIAIRDVIDGGALMMPHIRFTNCQLPGYAEWLGDKGKVTHGGISFTQCNFRNFSSQAPGNAGSTFLRWTGSNDARYRFTDSGVLNISNM
jgi:hypothetical protein